MPGPEGLAPYPVSPVDQIDAYMTDAYVTDQIAFMEARAEVAVTPLEAHYIGHSAVGTSVEMGSEMQSRPPEAGASEAAAGIWRSFSPFNAENAPMFGDEQGRLAAVEAVRGIANQAHLTNKYLNGAHKAAARRLAMGEITQDQHDEQVGQIAAVMALTNPQHLRNVGEAQRKSIERRKRAGQLGEDVQFVDVTSRVTENGMELAGIDSVVAQMTGARNHAELTANGLSLKRESYGDAAMAKATERHEKQQAALRQQAAEQAEIRRTIDLIDEDDRKRAKNSKENKYSLAA